MTYPLQPTVRVGGMYTSEQKQRIELVLENRPVAEVVAYIEEHADRTDRCYEGSLNYVRGKKEFMLDVLKLDGELIVHYANQSRYNKYYYTLRITAFNSKE